MTEQKMEKFLTEVIEEIEQDLDKVETVANRLIEFSDTTEKKRKELRDRLHKIQAILAKPEVEEIVAQEEKENPSEGSPYHPEYQKVED